MGKPDALAALDGVLEGADIESSPWEWSDGPEGERMREYRPDYDLLHRLLAIPIEQGHTVKQQSGRLAKALDAYVAHELRRAGFPEAAVFPRARPPRVLAAEFAEVERRIAALEAALEDHEKEAGARLKPASVRQGILGLRKALPGRTDAYVLGRFYPKQVDVAVSDWHRGPDVLVSGKSMLSSFGKNLKTRYEEAIGEAYNLRDRYPLAAMGYAYVVQGDVVGQKGVFGLLSDLLVRLRRPDGPFDATMLLVAEWERDPPGLLSVKDDVAPGLTASRFFENLLDAVIDSTPVPEHNEVRRRKEGEPPGGLPDEDLVVSDERESEAD